MLLRSLPHEVRSYATLHAAGDAYVDFRAAALRFEQQQRMFAELSGSSSSGARGVHALESAETAEEWWGYDQEGYDNSEYAQEEDPDDEWEWDEDAQMWISATVARGKVSPKSNVKCHLCGRRGHIAKHCKADMSKVKEWMKGQQHLSEELEDNQVGYLGARAGKRLITDCYGRGVVRGTVETCNLILKSGRQNPTAAESIKTAQAKLTDHGIKQVNQNIFKLKLGADYAIREEGGDDWWPLGEGAKVKPLRHDWIVKLRRRPHGKPVEGCQLSPHKRPSRQRVITGPEDPRLRLPQFQEAPLIVANNDSKYQVNKDRARKYARDAGATLRWATAKDVASSEALQAQDKLLLRGKRGIVHSWLWPEGQPRPSIVYVKFEGAEWQLEGLEEPGVYPVVPKTSPWYLDKGRQVKTLKVSRTQLPLTPAFSMTARSSQGKTLRAVLLDLQVDGRVDPTIGTVATTRVRSREDVLIMRPFLKTTFQCGMLSEGPDLLLQKLAGQEID
eukprot:s5092_g4.t1